MMKVSKEAIEKKSKRTSEYNIHSHLVFTLLLNFIMGVHTQYSENIRNQFLHPV
ncbi:hypothetical protein C1646_773279 [Rhizophagus diaphanus]|nr:hypothetical protein C1646_773279 [Rhizophagus diaphanus] [Rhizophagus sp. MUCL 43196]